MECNSDGNKQKCNCTYTPCPRKGFCCECVAYHRRHDELPACFFSAAAERSHDRSVERFIADRRR